MKAAAAAVLFAFVAMLASASASSKVLANPEAEEQARTIFSSGGTYYLALNTTYLIYYGVLIGLGALAIVALAGAGSGQSTQSYGSQSNYGYSLREDEFVGDDDYESLRQKRSAFNDGNRFDYKQTNKITFEKKPY